MAPNKIGGSKKKSNLPIEREGIKPENPELYYTFDSDEIGKGKFSVVKKVTCKKTGKVFAAKIIKFDEETLKFAMREYDIMVGKINEIQCDSDDNIVSKSVPKVHETYLVRKYLIIIMTLCDGKTLLDFFASKHSISEEDVAIFVKWLLEVLNKLHSNNVVHLDIRPTNIRMTGLNDIWLLDYNSARHLANKKAGEVVDVIGDTEFCAPEMLSFDRVQPASDTWSVAVIMYILLTGVSPYYYDDESIVSSSVERCKYSLTIPEMDGVSAQAKDFIKKIFKRGPEMRMTAAAALDHEWLSLGKQASRKDTKIPRQDAIGETDTRLFSEEEEDYIEASLVFKTFEEEEFVSPEESSDEED